MTSSGKKGRPVKSESFSGGESESDHDSLHNGGIAQATESIGCGHHLKEDCA